MKLIAAIALAAALSRAAAAPALAQAAKPAAPAAAAPAAAKKFSVESTVGDLLNNPAAKAVLVKYIPEVVADPNLQMGLELPLTGIVQYVPQLTPDMMAKIDADLKKI